MELFLHFFQLFYWLTVKEILNLLLNLIWGNTSVPRPQYTSTVNFYKGHSILALL